jgi:hypothetical protein
MNHRAAPLLAAMLLFLGTSVALQQPAEARRAFARGQHGVAGVYASQGKYLNRAGTRALGANAGFGARAASFNGPNGTNAQFGAGGAYKRGTGGFRAKQFSATGANGGSANGYMNNVYNAQTGTGMRNSGKSYTNAQGQTYGYDGSTSYTKGQGATSSINTQNKGDYTVDWQKGEKPVVTTVPATTSVSETP